MYAIPKTKNGLKAIKVINLPSRKLAGKHSKYLAVAVAKYAKPIKIMRLNFFEYLRLDLQLKEMYAS